MKINEKFGIVADDSAIEKAIESLGKNGIRALEEKTN